MFVKNKQTNVVINTDDSHYRSVVSAREINRRNETLCSEIAALKSELGDIRDLLQKVIRP